MFTHSKRAKVIRTVWTLQLFLEGREWTELGVGRSSASTLLPAIEILVAVSSAFSGRPRISHQDLRHKLLLRSVQTEQIRRRAVLA